MSSRRLEESGSGTTVCVNTQIVQQPTDEQLLMAAETMKLLADATRLAAAAGSANVEVSLEIWPHMIHAWPVWNARLADGRQALSKAGQFIRAHLQGPP